MDDSPWTTERLPGLKELLLFEALEARFAEKLQHRLPARFEGARVEPLEGREQTGDELLSEAPAHLFAAQVKLKPRKEIFLMMFDAQARDALVDFHTPVNPALPPRAWTQLDVRQAEAFVQLAAEALAEAWSTSRSKASAESFSPVPLRQALPGSAGILRRRTFVLKSERNQPRFELATFLSSVRLTKSIP